MGIPVETENTPGAAPVKRRRWSQVLIVAAGVLLVGYGALVVVWNRFIRSPQYQITGKVMSGLQDAGNIAAARGACKDWNVLIVTFDTTRADHIGCYGHQGVKTPVLDGLARLGVLCAQAITTVPATLPAHSGILTGLYPFHHGVRANGTFKLDDQQVTLPEILREHGYRTGAAISAYVLDETYGLSQGFEEFDDDLTRGVKYAPNMYRERAAELTNESFLPWLREHGREKFFCWLHYFDPHATYLPPEPFRTDYAADLYSGEIAYADSQLGQVLKTLEELGVHDRTLIVMTSDHGEGLGEHGEQTHSLLIYDATMHVPLILSAPGAIPSGQVIRRQVCTIDIAPTILDLLGIDPPVKMDGVSLLAPPPAEPRPLYIETLSSMTLHGWAPLLGVRREDYKYILAPRAEVYDLAKDPRELNNLFHERPDLAVDMHELLKGFVGEDPLLAADVQENLELDEEAMSKLAALGYITTRFESEEQPASREARIDPKDGVLHWERVHEGVMKRDQGDLLGAIQILEECLQKVPGDVFARQVLASCYQTQGRQEDSLAQLVEAERLCPTDITLPLACANNLLQLRRMDEALAAIERARKIDPDHPGIYQQYAAIANSRNNLDEAMAQFEKALEVDRGSHRATILRNIGDIHMRRGEREKAREAFEEALKGDAFNGEALAGMAELAVADNDDDKALELLQQALRFDPVQPRALSVLAGIYIRRNRLDEAVRTAERALQIAPKFAAASANLGLAWRMKGDEAKAEQIYRDAIAVQPRYDVLHQNLAQLLLRQGRTDEAIDAFKEAVRCNPYNTVAIVNVAVHHFQNQEFELARRFLRRALTIDPKYALAHKHLGVLLLRMNRVPQAMFHLKRSLELDPQQPEAGLIRFQLETYAAQGGTSQPTSSDLEEPLDEEPQDLPLGPGDEDEKP